MKDEITMNLQLAAQTVARQIEVPVFFKSLPDLKRLELLTDASRRETLDF